MTFKQRPCLQSKMQPLTFLLFFMVIFLQCSDAQIINFNAIDRCVMRGFGEPHIETCNDDGIDTICYAPGHQTYLDIFFLRVDVVHKVWRTDVTVISEIFIDFKSLAHPHDIMYKFRATTDGSMDMVYEAPSIPAIDKVKISHTVTVKSHELSQTYLDSGPIIELSWPHTAIVIIINIFMGELYQITLRGAKDVMNKASGMLIDGCPPDQIFPGENARRKRVASNISIGEATAEAACLMNNVSAGTSDMRACVFDVITTGSTAIAAAAGMAIVDRTRAVSMDKSLIQSARVWNEEAADCTLEMDITMIDQPPRDLAGSSVEPYNPIWNGWWPPTVPLENRNGRDAVCFSDTRLKSWYLAGNQKSNVCFYFGMFSMATDDTGNFRCVLSDGCNWVTDHPATFQFWYRANPMAFRVEYKDTTWECNPGGNGVNSWTDAALFFVRSHAFYTGNTPPDWTAPLPLLFVNSDDCGLQVVGPAGRLTGGYFEVQNVCQLNLGGNELEPESKYTGCMSRFQVMYGLSCPTRRMPPSP